MASTEHSSRKEQPLPKDSIFNYYSIPNEIQFLQKNPMTPQKQKFYIRENVLRFLGEFVGQIPYTTITYTSDREGLDFAGVKVLDSYEKAAEIAGMNTREWYETEGFRKINSLLTQNGPQTIVWISPPKTADYAFAFVFEKAENDVVREYILRYNESRGSVATSSSLLSRLVTQPVAFHRAEQFLLSPISSHDFPNLSIGSVMNNLHIDPDLIQKSKQFEQETEQKLAPWIDLYAQGVRNLATIDRNSNPLFYDKTVEELQAIMSSIYTMAEIIKDDINHNSNTFSHTIATSRQGAASYDQQSYTQGLFCISQKLNQSKPAVVQIIGSCPVTTAGNQSGLPISNHQLSELLKAGRPYEAVLDGDRYADYPCPKCGEMIQGELKLGVWKKACPHCQEAISCQQNAPALN